MQKRLLAALLAAVAVMPCLSAQDTGRSGRLKDHVYYFAADSLNGRKAGSDDALKAAEYISREYEAAGLKPFFEDWMLRFYVAKETECRNVVGVIEGSDPKLKDEYIVLGAHYDHLGVRGGEIYNGADDNASGSAALIEVAKELSASRDQLRRSVIIAAFDAEELGLYGSKALCSMLADSLGRDRIKLMMSVDMVGWYRQSGVLELEGAATIRDGKQLLESEAAKYSINIKPKRFETSVFTATDTEAFARKGVPTLAVTTGLKSPYHKPGDDADLIDYEGLDKVTGYIAGLAADVASDPDFDGSGKVAKKHRQGLPMLEFGILAGVGNSNVDFPEGAMDGKPEIGWQAGVNFNFNVVEHWAVRLQGFYNRSNSLLAAPDNAYGPGYVLSQDAVTVPLTLQFQTGGGEFFVGAGGFYRHVFDYDRPVEIESLGAVNPDQFGLDINFGMRLGSLVYSFDFLGQKNRFFGPSGAIKPGPDRMSNLAHYNSFAFNLIWVF